MTADKETGAPAPAPDPKNSVSEKLQTLEQMDTVALQKEWRRVYRVPPPKRLSCETLMLGVTWKIQERAYGGLRAATKRRLEEMAKSLAADGDIPRRRITSLRPGAKLIREWRGETHTVIVTEDGFEWRGRKWRSLSAIARAITGARWSGPRFFGLKEGASQLHPEPTEDSHGAIQGR